VNIVDQDIVDRLTADGLFEHPKGADVDESLRSIGFTREGHRPRYLVRGNYVFVKDGFREGGS
jgi:hypothetical protein